MTKLGSNMTKRMSHIAAISFIFQVPVILLVYMYVYVYVYVCIYIYILTASLQFLVQGVLIATQFMQTINRL